MLNIGASLGRYTVRKQLADGEVTSTFEVTADDRSYALQVLRLRDPDFAERLRRAAAALQELRHPNVLAVEEIVDVYGSPGVVTERMEGGTLEAWIAQGPQPGDALAGVFRQIAKGLGAAHAAGVLHRNLQPNKVLLGRRGAGPPDVKVADFLLGMVRQVTPTGGPALTQLGTTFGAPQYMSPEQFRGTGDIDHRSDLFSLGCVLYEMATGRRAFDGASMMEIYGQVNRCAVPPVPTLRPELPVWVDDVVRGLLVVEPDGRLPSADAVLERIPSAGPAIVFVSTPPPRPTEVLRVDPRTESIFQVLIDSDAAPPAEPTEDLEPTERIDGGEEEPRDAVFAEPPAAPELTDPLEDGVASDALIDGLELAPTWIPDPGVVEISTPVVESPLVPPIPAAFADAFEAVDPADAETVVPTDVDPWEDLPVVEPAASEQSAPTLPEPTLEAPLSFASLEDTPPIRPSLAEVVFEPTVDVTTAPTEVPPDGFGFISAPIADVVVEPTVDLPSWHAEEPPPDPISLEVPAPFVPLVAAADEAPTEATSAPISGLAPIALPVAEVVVEPTAVPADAAVVALAAEVVVEPTAVPADGPRSAPFATFDLLGSLPIPPDRVDAAVEALAPIAPPFAEVVVEPTEDFSAFVPPPLPPLPPVEAFAPVAEVVVEPTVHVPDEEPELPPLPSFGAAAVPDFFPPLPSASPPPAPPTLVPADVDAPTPSPLEEGLSKYDFFFDAEPRYDTLDAPSPEPISAPITEPAPPSPWLDPASAPTEEPAAATFPSLDEPPPLDPPAPTFTAYDGPSVSFDAPPVRAPAWLEPTPPPPAADDAPPRLSEAPTQPGPEPLGGWAPPMATEEDSYEDRPTQPIAEADWTSSEEEPWVANVELEDGPSVAPEPTPIPEPPTPSPEEPLARSWFADIEPGERTYDDADDGPVLIAPADVVAGDEALEVRRIPLSNEAIFVLSLTFGMLTGALVLFGLGSLVLSAVRNF